MVVVVGIDPTSWAYEARAHPSTPYNLISGVSNENRTRDSGITTRGFATKLWTPYRNTFNISSMLAQRTFRPCQGTERWPHPLCGYCPSKMFLYGELIAGRISKPAFAPITGLSYQLEDREFLRLITPQHGCYRPIAFTI